MTLQQHHIINKRPLHLFDAYGVEMEYMIIDRDTLDIIPMSDRLLVKKAGHIVNEIQNGLLAWSNELVLHVIELKTDGPVNTLKNLASVFQTNVREVNQILSAENACLMPSAMHPWMDPFSEMRLWPHEYNPIYDAYNRIFDCRGHGFANLQSTHLNLPFHNDTEFAALHAACRLALPLIPALAASSPIADGETKPWIDFRMEVYRTNSAKIPSITGYIIPEAIFTQKQYQSDVFERMYRDISHYDPEGILPYEWLSSRGAMSRFDRGSIEIRVIDIQECPKADIAILEILISVIQAMCKQTWSSLEQQMAWDEKKLFGLLMQIVKEGENAIITDSDYLKLFGYPGVRASAIELWSHLFESLNGEADWSDETSDTVKTIIEQGPLARRILHSLPANYSRSDLANTYRALATSLQNGDLFLP